MNKKLALLRSMKEKCQRKIVPLVLSGVLVYGTIVTYLPQKVVEAATLNIPNTSYITKNEIIDICNKTNNGEGLLATGTDSDVKLRISFGNRPEDIKHHKNYYDFKNNPSGTVVSAGDIRWYITGKEDDNRVVLYTENPILPPSHFGSNVAVFNKNKSGSGNWFYNTKNIAEMNIGTYLDGVAKPENVLANHWGASDIREIAQEVYNGTGFFSGKNYFENNEKILMKESTVITKDIRIDKNYATDDILYLPIFKNSENAILVGEKDNITIDNVYYASVHWIRTPSDIKTDKKIGAYATRVIQENGSNSPTIDDGNTSFAPAFALDISNLRFASVGDGTATAKLEKVEDDSPMRLRLGEGAQGYPFTSKYGIKSKGHDITYSAPKDSYLMFLAKDANGVLYQYAKKIDSDVTNKTMSLTNIPGLDKGESFSAKVWIEKEAGGTLSYATEPIDVYNVISWGDIKDERVDDVIQYVDKEGKTSVEIKEDNLKDDTIWLKEESGDESSWCGIEIPDGEIELDKGLRFCVKRLSPGEKGYDEIYSKMDIEQQKKIQEYNGIIFRISVEDIDGKKVDFRNSVKVYIQLEEKWNPESLEAYLVTEEGNVKIDKIDIKDVEDPEKKDSFAIMLMQDFASIVVYPTKLLEEEPDKDSTKEDNQKEDNQKEDITEGKDSIEDKKDKENNLVKDKTPNTGDINALIKIPTYIRIMFLVSEILFIMYCFRKSKNKE